MTFKPWIVLPLLAVIIFTLVGFTLLPDILNQQKNQGVDINTQGSLEKESYWFILKRESNLEEFYRGVPGDKSQSVLVKTFKVKTGIPGERPTPLPQLLGREYWVITGFKEDEGPETAPYFLTLNIPTKEEEPFGPEPYLECNGQCNWVTPGEFGLHGTAGHPERLADTDPGSSGCIRHSDDEITYLYNLLRSEKEQIRYYIQDT